MLFIVDRHFNTKELRKGSSAGLLDPQGPLGHMFNGKNANMVLCWLSSPLFEDKGVPKAASSHHLLRQHSSVLTEPPQPR